MTPRKTIVTLIFIILLVMVTTGCWNRRELNDLAIVMAIGVDKQGKEYQVSAQVVVPGEVGKKGTSVGAAPVVTYQTSGPSMFECMRKMTTISPRKLYMSHVRILIIQENIAKEGLQNVLDFFFRDPEFRPDFYVAIAKKHKASEILGIFTQLEKIPANKLLLSLETSEKRWAPTVAVHLDELISAIVTPGINPVLTGVTIVGDKEKGKTKENIESIIPPAKLVFTDIGVFQKDKLIGWFNEPESKGYNYIMGNVTSTVGHVLFEKKEKIILELLRTKSEIKADIVDGKPVVEVNITAQGNVAEVEGKINLLTPASMGQLEKALEKRIKTLTDLAIRKAQKKLHTDVFGFGSAIHRANPALWKKMQKDWNKRFANLKINVKVEGKLKLTGKVNQSFIQELNKK